MFSDRIKELRSLHNITQKDFANRVGISTTTLISYEKSGKVPSYDILIRIATTFNISLDWLCEVTVDEENQTVSAADVALLVNKLMRLCSAHEIVQDFHDPNLICIELSFLTEKLRSFLLEYSKMSKLLTEKTIDEELFGLWFNKKITDLNGVEIMENYPFQ